MRAFCYALGLAFMLAAAEAALLWEQGIGVALVALSWIAFGIAREPGRREENR